MSKTDKASGSAPLTMATIQRIVRTLPELDLNRPTDLAACNADLQHYFSTYGFDCLASYPYFLGVLNLASYRVAVHCWRCPAPRATVLVSHGLFDHVGLYLDLVEYLCRNDIDVIAIDFPGHGLSDGAPAEIEDFGDYSTLITQMVGCLGESFSDPWYGVGQSTGGAALLSYLLMGDGKRFARLVLLAPLLRPKSWSLINTTYTLLHKYLRSVPRNFKPNSHRAGFHEFLAHGDPLQARHISVPWVGAMKKWIEDFASLPTSNIPALIIQGDNDDTVDWQWNLPRIASKFSECEICMIPGAMHHLVKEGDAWRDPVFSALLRFLLPNN